MKSLFLKKWLSNHIDREHADSAYGSQNQYAGSANNLHSERPLKFSRLNKKQNTDNNASVSAYGKNHHRFVFGSSNAVKTYYMLKILQKVGNKRPIHIITRSPNQYLNSITDTEIQPIHHYKGSIVFLMIC